jgi:hypothetical protein
LCEVRLGLTEKPEEILLLGNLTMLDNDRNKPFFLSERKQAVLKKIWNTDNKFTSNEEEIARHKRRVQHRRAGKRSNHWGNIKDILFSFFFKSLLLAPKDMPRRNFPFFSNIRGYSYLYTAAERLQH